jgi:GT2 family glycosyltransferase
MLALAGDERRILAACATGTATRRWSVTGQPGIYDSIPIGRTPVDVDAVATACVLIHREVFDAIADQHGRSWFHAIHLAKSPAGTPPRDFAYVVNGEDIAFSMRAKAAGFKIWCVHVPGLKHYKTMPLSHDDEQSKLLGSRAAGEGMGVLVQET